MVRYFYPRSPCGERRLMEHLDCKHTKDFYPRSPCGERQPSQLQPQPIQIISIHALLAESDCSGKLSLSGIRTFLSTLSLRRATRPGLLTPPMERFLSTLSLRRATGILQKRGHEVLFLSTLSLRRATCFIVFLHFATLFLSTLSLRRATSLSGRVIPNQHISIHALLAESDDAKRANQ